MTERTSGALLTQQPQNPAKPAEGMQPTRDPRVTLPDLLEVLLNKGVYLNLDLIIAVADVPLIGVNLRATIAGLETMLEYGMMRSWDERTRAWVTQAVARHLPLLDGEEVVARMAGGHYAGGDHPVWRPGTVYLTTRRLIAYRREPQEILWQTALADVESSDVRIERSIGGEDRSRLHVTTTDGSTTVLSAAEAQRLHDMLRRETGASVTGTENAPPSGSEVLISGRMWFREEHAGKRLWRGGTGTLDTREGLTWKGALDTRPAVRLRPEEITSATVRTGDTPLLDTILLVRSRSGDVHLAADSPEQWAGRILQMLQERTAHAVGANR